MSGLDASAGLSAAPFWEKRTGAHRGTVRCTLAQDEGRA